MRYIGNKTKLLDKLDSLLKRKGLDKKGLKFCDLFAGTCTVGDYFKEKYEIIANDTLYTSYVISNGKLKYSKDFFSNLGFDPFEYFNNVDTSNYTSGFCYNNFAPSISDRQYFSDENAKLIDFIRNTIDEWFDSKKINENEKYYLIGSLLESVSKVSNVAGVYSAFLKIWDSRAVKKMEFIPIEMNEIESKYQNEVYIEDVNDLITKIKGDILYLDPPYTPTQYISQYHVLETIARNDNPETHGKGAHRNNGNQISNWCKKGLVHEEFEKLIANANFKYIVFSYSDAGIMSKEYIEKVLKRYAKEGTYEFKKISFIKYKSTRAVAREIKENTKDKEHFEWLFFIEKNNNPKYISPLNYIGGKWDVIPLIKDNLPTKINTFYDLFGGGGTVSLNINANKVVYNDINWIVRDLLEKITHDDFITTYNYIEKTIKKWHLEKKNKEIYMKFREKYNSVEKGSRNPLDLYLLICYGFEHQIRFNSKMEFNNPCGNSGYNQEMLEKIVSYSNRTKKMNIVFKSLDYKKYLSEINKGDFVYCDPPYLISCGAYNDGKRGFNGWDETQEQELLEFLDKLNLRGIKFMLSNMQDRNMKTNTPLQRWIQKNNYKVIVNNVITKRNRQDRQEIIIINY
jgi:adenine-specific DNA-methyltransferase